VLTVLPVIKLLSELLVNQMPYPLLPGRFVFMVLSAIVLLLEPLSRMMPLDEIVPFVDTILLVMLLLKLVTRYIPRLLPEVPSVVTLLLMMLLLLEFVRFIPYARSPPLVLHTSCVWLCPLHGQPIGYVGSLPSQEYW